MLLDRVLSKDMRSGTLNTLDAGWGLFLTADTNGVRLRDGGINTARVTQPDILATNGVVHVIDEVLVPAALVGPIHALKTTTWTKGLDVVSLLISLPKFSTLVSLLKRAGLMSVLALGSLTMFAPTNDAWSKLPEGMVEFLTRPGPKNAQALVCAVDPIGQCNVVLTVDVGSYCELFWQAIAM